MALIERLMHTDPDDGQHIAVHQFFAAMAEVNSGYLTLAQVKSFLNTSPEDDAELDVLAASVTGSVAARQEIINGFHAVLMLAETKDIPGYTTEAQVRARLGL